MDPIKELQDKTITTQFILPMAYLNKNFTDLDKDFKNAYIASIDDVKDDSKIVIICGQHDEKTVIEPPNHYIDDYFKVLDGQYSKLSENYKQHLLSFWKADKNTYLYKILYRDKNLMTVIKNNHETSLGDIECWYPPNISEEIYGIGA